ncbi:ATPase-like ParA/MinD [Penicillium coprophilum]|uniref:ATPase-like ParA/MinD n=1 Tax=Penicillium coprophilum TaxID=36646 RepID=UPI002383D1FD|nr:ATPase-like ParA/MinD [Penicillium coprophilum]KAJ5173502.1 ATPase-like ParA/MinD [Penicillium coprophilum]
MPEKRKIRDVKKVVAVSSAKGGVGKSTIAGMLIFPVPIYVSNRVTTAQELSAQVERTIAKEILPVNLALSFARRGIKTGILDTDIFGPSVPTLLNLSGEPRLDENNCLVPLTNYGLKSMSMGYLLPQTQADSTTGELPMDTTPISWRGLMVTKAMHQLLHSVSWEVIIDGAVIVSTPQDIALRDAVRGIGMFQRMEVPVLGMVRNMAYFACPQCGTQTRIFSHGDNHHHAHGENHGVVAECKRLGVDFLGDIPLDARVCEDADRGMPTVVAEESDERSARREAFLGVAEQVARKIGLDWR